MRGLVPTVGIVNGWNQPSLLVLTELVGTNCEFKGQPSISNSITHFIGVNLYGWRSQPIWVKKEFERETNFIWFQNLRTEHGWLGISRDIPSHQGRGVRDPGRWPVQAGSYIYIELLFNYFTHLGNLDQTQLLARAQPGEDRVQLHHPGPPDRHQTPLQYNCRLNNIRIRIINDLSTSTVFTICSYYF